MQTSRKINTTAFRLHVYPKAPFWAQPIPCLPPLPDLYPFTPLPYPSFLHPFLPLPIPTLPQLYPLPSPTPFYPIFPCFNLSPHLSSLPHPPPTLPDLLPHMVKSLLVILRAREPTSLSFGWASMDALYSFYYFMWNTKLDERSKSLCYRKVGIKANLSIRNGKGWRFNIGFPCVHVEILTE